MNLSSEDLQSLMPTLTEEQQQAVMRFYLETTRRTETKRLSANKMYESIVHMLKSRSASDPKCIKNGREWRLYRFKDVIITPPIHIESNGKCQRGVPLHSLERSRPYDCDILTFLEEIIYEMNNHDGKLELRTRQMQQEQRRINIENGSGSASAIPENERQSQHQSTPNSKLGPPYATPVSCMTDLELIERYGVEQKRCVYPYVKLFSLNSMLKSVMDNMTQGAGLEYGECVLDDGGCFITSKGMEKILMFRHAFMQNLVLVQHMKKAQGNSRFQVEIRSEHVNEYRSTSTFYFNFIDDKLIHLDETTGQLMNVGYVVGRISDKIKNVPFVIWIRALGFETDDEIRNLYRQVIGGPECIRDFESKVLERCLMDHQGCKTSADAILKIGSMTDKTLVEEHWFYGLKKLRTEVLPHIGKALPKDQDLFREQCRAKARFLCYMFRKLILAAEEGMNQGQRSNSSEAEGLGASGSSEGSGNSDGQDDTETEPSLKSKNPFLQSKNNYFYRQYQTIDELVLPLIQTYVREFMDKIVPRTILKRLDHGQPVNYYQTFYMQHVTRKFNYNISMGVWQTKPTHKNTQTGISQNVNRHNHLETLVQHDKVMNPIHKEGKQIEPRLQDETGIMISDAADTPEGESAGLHRQRTQGSHQAIGCDPDLVICMLKWAWMCGDSYILPGSLYQRAISLDSCISKLLESYPHISFYDDRTKQFRNPKKNTSFKAYRLMYDFEVDAELLKDCKVLYWTIAVNQIPIGFTVRPDALLRQIRLWRRENVIGREISCGFAERADPYDVTIGSLMPYQCHFPVASSHTHGVKQDEPENFRGPVFFADTGQWVDSENMTQGKKIKRIQRLPFNLYEPYENEYWCRQARHLQEQRGEMWIDVRTQVGRNMRLAYVVENLHRIRHLKLSQLTKNKLLEMGILEYLEVNESRDTLIAMDLSELDRSVQQWMRYCDTYGQKDAGSSDTYPASKRTNTYSHLELHPSMIFGICSALIPFAQCDPPARISFADHMMKGAQGKATSISKLLRMDTNYNEMWISERPQVTTQVYEAIGIYILSHTINLDVVFLCGKNEEDGIRVNGSIVDAGYLNSSNYHTYTIHEKRNKDITETIRFVPPDSVIGYKIGCDYGKLDERGIIREESAVEKNTVLVQKSINGVDTSYVYPGNKFSVVDRVLTFTNDQGLMTVKIRLRETRKFSEADKIASNHSQKATASELSRRENMLYDVVDRSFPDVVYSCISKVSRMTLAMMLEMMMGRIAALTGEFVDATPLSQNWIDFFLRYFQKKEPSLTRQQFIERFQMKQYENGCDWMLRLHEQLLAEFGTTSSVSHVDMRTGERIPGLIFRGMCSMMKLRQMILDGIKARGTGQKSYASKQPCGTKAAGVGADPGQKIGTMEAGNLSSYGAAHVIHDRLLLSSDAMSSHICQYCNTICIYVQKDGTNFTFCQKCNKVNSARQVVIGGTFNLFTKELAACGWSTTFETADQK